MTRFFTSFGLAALILILAGTAGAVPVTVAHVDFLTCDPLFVPSFVDELGLGPLPPGFPPDEEIRAFDVITPDTSCGGPLGISDNPAIPNVEVEIENLTPFDFDEVWYVADPNFTFISNVDGAVTSGPPGTAPGDAFRIDSLFSDPFGINHPLVFESGIPNDIFEAGETWEFIIQDYGNALGLPPELFLSPGCVGIDSSIPGLCDIGVPAPSSGSIIATRSVPEPAPLLLVGLGLASLAFVRRRAVPGR